MKRYFRGYGASVADYNSNLTTTNWNSTAWKYYQNESFCGEIEYVILNQDYSLAYYSFMNMTFDPSAD